MPAIADASRCADASIMLMPAQPMRAVVLMPAIVLMPAYFMLMLAHADV